MGRPKQQIPTHSLPYEQLEQRYWNFLLKKSTWQIPGYSQEDVLQELRLLLCRCQRMFDPSQGVPFFSYFKIATRNRLGQLRIKAKHGEKLMAEGTACDVTELELSSVGARTPKALMSSDDDPDIAAQRIEDQEELIRAIRALSPIARAYIQSKLLRQKSTLSDEQRVKARREVAKALNDRLESWKDSLWVMYNESGRVTTSRSAAKTMRKRYV